MTNPDISDHHLWPMFTVMPSEKQTITKQPPHRYFTTDPSYFAISKALMSLSCCLAKVWGFFVNEDWQSMNLDTLVIW